MTTPAFWFDMACYSLTAVLALSLLLLVLGMGLRRFVNAGFALFLASAGLWAIASVSLRGTLALGSEASRFWAEFAAFAYMLVGPALLALAATFVQIEGRWPYVVAMVTLVLSGVIGIPLFGHQIIQNVRLEAGAAVWDQAIWGVFLSVPLVVNSLLALLLTWRERAWREHPYLSISLAVLCLFALASGFLRLGSPAVGLAMSAVSVAWGYLLARQQVLGPLEALKDHLEEQVLERTQASEQTATELHRAYLRSQRHATFLQTAAQVASSVSAIRDLDRLLDTTAQLISDRFGFYHAAIFLLDEEREHAVLRAASSDGGKLMLARGYRVPVNAAGAVSTAARTGEFCVALDLGENATVFEYPDLPYTRSEIALPLKVRGQVIGVLDVQSAEAAVFAEEDASVLQILADQLTMGLENAKLFEQTQASLEELSRLYEVMTVEAWEQFSETNPEQRRYRSGGDDIPERTWAALFGQARSEGKPISVLVETQGRPTWQLLAVPVELRGISIGVLGFYRGADGGLWKQEEIVLAQGVAERAAMALENVRLLEEARRRGAREQMTRQIVDRIRRAGDVEQVLQETASEISQALKVPHVSIELSVDGLT